MPPTFNHGISAAQAATLAAVLYPPHCAVQVGTPRIFSGIGGTQTQQRDGLAVALPGDTMPARSGSATVRWHRISDCVAAAPGQRVVVCANTPCMTAFLSEDAVRSVWPHARGLRTELREARTVDSVLADTGELSTPDWLMVDCHPAGEVLQGAKSLLGTVQVLWVAVALELPPLWPHEASLDAVDGLAESAGLKRIWAGAGLNPMLGQALYVRDPVGLLHQRGKAEARLAEMADVLAQERSANVQANETLVQTAQTLAETQAELVRLEECLALARLENAALTEHASQVEGLETELAAQAQGMDALRLEILQHVMAHEALREESANLARQNADLQQALSEQTGSHEELQRYLDERVAEIEILQQAMQMLEADKAARRAGALEDFRLARLHAQREAERQRLQQQTAMKASEMEARLANLHQMMTLVSEQLCALRRITPA